MEKKSLKQALDVKALDEFVKQGTPEARIVPREEVDLSTKQQIDEPEAPKTEHKKDKVKKLEKVKITFYIDPQIQKQIEAQWFKVRGKTPPKGKKISRSDFGEALLRSGLKNERVMDEIV